MLSLRRVEPGDSDRMFTWRNLPHVAIHQYSDHEITRPEHDAWFARILADPRRVYWIIQDGGEPIGLANLVDIDQQNSKCSWAFYLGASDLRGKGIGSWVELKVLDYVFLELKLNKLCCEVLTSNPGVVRMHKRFGFQEEGLLRAHVRKGGQFLDAHVLGLLRDDYLAQRDDLVAMLRKLGMQTE
ncbi:MAG: UDP-4-amino-4,6-dideoxy-N-acetyl-beta-L-altrosamine N-acetyltransferase [Inquilinus limosus]|uniref:UDP-4-amino-4, 6-dideoxy-N-acetyl-beta-L-altrosamine N-acetyltransferase n=1 Tax=Inquilinus limosus TaxID=171674 RepID=A0A952FFM5_9PROT|nr:UDP-4-amino-4,6-dideoxy-N-acetyl-beta-L-altrosamine N-acetyltransferase [Inquilinus limosus]